MLGGVMADLKPVEKTQNEVGKNQGLTPAEERERTIQEYMAAEDIDRDEAEDLVDWADGM